MPLPGMMSFAGGMSALVGLVSSSTATSGTPSRPSGMYPDDIMIAFNGAQDTGGGSWSGDTGWTEAIDQGAAPNFRAAYKVVAGGEPSSYTFTYSGGGVVTSGIACFRGYTYDTASASVTTMTGAGDLVIPQITSAGGILLALAASRTGHAEPTVSGMTKVFHYNPGLSAPGLSLFYENVAAGATGSRTMTFGTVAEVGGILIGITR